MERAPPVAPEIFSPAASVRREVARGKNAVKWQKTKIEMKHERNGIDSSSRSLDPIFVRRRLFFGNDRSILSLGLTGAGL